MNSLNLLDDNVIFGKNSLSKIQNVVKQNNYKKILLLTGKSSFKVSGAETVLNSLETIVEVNHYSYSGIALPIDDIDAIYQDIKKIRSIDLIIGLGGGTVLDITKIISLLYSNCIEDINDILVSKNLKSSIDLVLIPTTAGSGSEATTFAVVYKDKQKYSVNSTDLGLKHVILDSQLLTNLPKEILKVTILDALSQSIESIWAKGATQISQKYATAALEILYNNLFIEKSLNNLGGYLLASHFAGKAINISKTTASHAISYPLTSEFGISHGLAVYLTLPNLCKYNYNNINSIRDFDKRNKLLKAFTDILFVVFDAKEINELFEKLQSLFVFFSFNSKLSSYNISHEDIEMVSEKAINNGRLDNNPINLEFKNIEELL